jgi:uncharacterized membrane protein YdbT with pleckstrin-like domain
VSEPYLEPERTVLRLHLHWMMLVRSLLLPLALLLVVLALDAWVGHRLPAEVRVIAALVALAAVAAWALEAWAVWVSATVTVTDKRITMAHGVTYRVRKVIPVEKFNNVMVRQSVLGQLFGYGTVEIAAPGMSTPASLPYIPAPQRLVDEILAQLGRSGLR